jgi:hypothetical protein
MLSEDDYRRGLRALSRDARSSDERAFMISTALFLHLRGEGDAYQSEVVRTYREFHTLLASTTGLTPTLRYKLNLLLYCHVLESDPVYVYLWNLIRVADGHDHGQYPFRRDSINSRIDKIRLAAQGSSYGIEQMLAQAVDTSLRDAFSHNQYLLDQAGITFSRSGRWLSYENLDGILLSAQALFAELLPELLRLQRWCGSPRRPIPRSGSGPPSGNGSARS